MARRARVLSHQVEAIEYRHADDGLPYRHDFERGDSTAELERDGSVRIRNRRARLWQTFDVEGRKQPFLVNPRGTRSMATKKKRAKRSPPKGFKTWAAYMATIRPGAKKARRKSRRTVSAVTRSEAPMARTRKRRRRNPAQNPPRRARRAVVSHRRRRNPPSGLSVNNLLGLAMDGAKHGALIVGGKVAVRQARRQLGYDAGSVVGSAVELGTALAIGLFGSKFLGRDVAVSLMRGGFSATIEAVVKSAKIPILSDSLGNQGMFDTETVALPADASGAMAGYARNGALPPMGGYSSSLVPSRSASLLA